MYCDRLVSPVQSDQHVWPVVRVYHDADVEVGAVAVAHAAEEVVSVEVLDVKFFCLEFHETGDSSFRTLGCELSSRCSSLNLSEANERTMAWATPSAPARTSLLQPCGGRELQHFFY